MDGPDAKRFLRCFFAVEYYHLLMAYCDLFAAMHFFLQRPIALVNPSSFQAQPAGPV